MDESITAPRIKIIALPPNTPLSGAKARAEWEKKTHIAKSFQIRVRLVGWTDTNGKLWEVNKLVTLDAIEAGVKRDNYLIETVKFSLDETKGQTTELTLVYGDAYSPEPQTDEDGMQE